MKRLKVGIILFVIICLFCHMDVYAAKYQNAVAKEDADFLFTLNADKTELRSGDIVTITLSVDKIPKNGIRAISCCMDFDSTKLAYVGSELGPVGEKFTGMSPTERMPNEGEVEFENQKVLVVGGYTGSGIVMTGIIEEFKFLVKGSVSLGDIKMQLRASPYGFDTCTENDAGVIDVPITTTFYVESNIDQLRVTETYITGDVNGDGKVTLADCTKVLAHVKKTKLLTGEELKRADVNCDGNVTLADCTKVLAHVKKTKLLW